MTVEQINEACDSLLKDPEVLESMQDVGKAYATFIVIRLYEKLTEILRRNINDDSGLSESGQSDAEQAD